MMANVDSQLPDTGSDSIRTAAHEDEDEAAVLRRFSEADFEDWPNEAGFVGLTEVRGPEKLEVRGNIPTWAAGTLYRTGPGAFEIEDTPKGRFRVTHWFDGFGQTHKFDITPGRADSPSSMSVLYTSRRQTQELVDQIRKDGYRAGMSFGQRADPCVGLFGKVMGIWKGAMSKTTTTSVDTSVTVQLNMPGLPSNAGGAQSGHRAGVQNAWLTTDATILKEMDPETLAPIGIAKQASAHPSLDGPLSCAHPQRDPVTGDVLNYNLNFGRFATYRIFRSNTSTGKTDILATISQADIRAAYIHSIFLSPSFVILCVPSTHLSNMGLSLVWNRNIIDAIEPFDESKKCRWIVVDRIGDRGIVAMFESPAGFFFHSINSFEETDEAAGQTHIFCDLVQYDTGDVLRSFELDVLLQNEDEGRNFWGDEKRSRNSQGRLRRYKLSVPKDGPCQSAGTKPRAAEKILEIKAPHIGELPTINPAYATKKYRYVYSVPNTGRSTLFDSLVKTDLETRTATFWRGPSGHTPGEAIFVPRPAEGDEALAEDDGVLMSVVLDGKGRKSYLLCLDAKTMEEMGRAECEWAIGTGFHGAYASVV